MRLRQRVNSFGNLQAGRQLVGVEAIAPLTDECHAKEKRTTERLAQGFGAIVTKARLRGSVSLGGRQVLARLHENEKPIFLREALALDANAHGGTPAPVFKKMS